MLPGIYPRKNILATNGNGLHQTVDKIIHNYFDRLRKKKKEDNKMGTPQKQHNVYSMYAAWIQTCDLEHQYINLVLLYL